MQKLNCHSLISFLLPEHVFAHHHVFDHDFH